MFRRPAAAIAACAVHIQSGGERPTRGIFWDASRGGGRLPAATGGRVPGDCKNIRAALTALADGAGAGRCLMVSTSGSKYKTAAEGAPP